ncbi:hypothetical protein [Rheinheimera baltica]|nr:hypothetical protein [Rheinheimera baltica]MDP5144118.1 hypothetical protein [Rheinheimera baltica]MDP5148938.1 hypothetical protein [Rheinheimera baltica]MDP5189902.1 hypothetical protein [Rheinheimera baltica]
MAKTLVGAINAPLAFAANKALTKFGISVNVTTNLRLTNLIRG